MTADSHARRKFRKQLLRLGFELVETNLMNAERYRRAGCADVWVHPFDRAAYIGRLSVEVEMDVRRALRFDPELSNESARKQEAWEQEEAARLEREAADAALVKDRRLGGASKVLSESEIDRITRQLEDRHKYEREMQRLMRSRPLAG